ncbi:MAG: FecR domain-containing protein [Azonexus sp.]
MKNNIRWIAVTLVCLSVNVMATEGDAAGMIKNSKGDVSIERAGARIQGVVGTPVFSADRVRTGSDGSVGVTLRDNTLLSAGPNSLFVLDKFEFDSTTNAGAISVGVRKGTLAVATGKIAKQTPESIDFHTPTSVIGVRGTEFAIEAGSGNED